MERFIKNDRKSIMGLNRLPEANQKDKPVRKLVCERLCIVVPYVTVHPV